MRFEDKTVVIASTGGSIGLGCVEAFRKEGAKVILLDSDSVEAAAAAESGACKVVPVECFYDDEAMGARIEAALAGNVADVVITCLKAKPADCAWNAYSEEEMHRIFDEIMTGVQVVLKYTTPGMLERESGSVVIVEDIAGRTGIPGMNVITSAAYAGLSGMIRNMGTTFGKNLVTVNGIAVGPIQGQYTEPAVAEACKAILPAAGTGLDVAYAAMYLADPAVFWNEGEIVDLNGGYFAN